MGKYFKYAIGEILLVVIGILIALQINNWNEDSKQKALGTELLLQVESELYRMQRDIANDLAFMNRGMQAHFTIKDALSSTQPMDSSLVFDFYWLMKDEYIYPVNAAFNRLKAEGLSIIDNDTIQKKLTSCYESIFPRLSKNESFHPDLEAFFSDYVQNNFTTNEDLKLTNQTLTQDLNLTFPYPYPKKINGKTYEITVGFVPKDFQALKVDPEFKVLLRQSYTFRRYKIRWYETATRLLDEVLESLDYELTKRGF